MAGTIRFLANDRVIETTSYAGRPALDFIRGELGLVGTKEGCREGDCGACAVIVGTRSGGIAPGSPRYRAVPSCLLALGDLEGCHLVTIEGLAQGAREASARSSGQKEAQQSGGRFYEESGRQAPARSSNPEEAPREEGRSSGGAALTPVMRALLEENGSQCGFCSPGFVVSLTAYLLEGPPFSIDSALAALDGNLCRCTGYGSIKRAAGRLVAEFAGLPADLAGRAAALETAGAVPASVGAFLRGELLPPLSELVEAARALPSRDATRPAALARGPDAASTEALPAGAAASRGSLVIAGGTDYFVREPDPEPRGGLVLLAGDPALREIVTEGDGDRAFLVVGAAVTWRDFLADSRVRALAPGIEGFERELASTLVRNRATLGGNVGNASPVGDLTSMLIALGARARIGGPAGRRELPLERLFLGYKRVDLAPGELVEAFALPAAVPAVRFSFEKVAKRARLDIAAVNSAAAFAVEPAVGRAGAGAAAGTVRYRITRARITAGGVAPVPLLLDRASRLLEGREADASAALEASRAARAEVAPISDVRGSAEYRRTLLGRLVLAHFVRAFPELGPGLAAALAPARDRGPEPGVTERRASDGRGRAMGAEEAPR